MSKYGIEAPTRPEPSDEATKSAALQALVDSDDELEKFASTAVEGAPTEEGPTTTEEARFEERRTEETAEAEEEKVAPTSSSDTWLPQPSIKDQVFRYPESVRTVDPETKMFDLSKAEDIKKFNEIQKAASDPEAPTMAILEKDKQACEGSWTLLVTYAKVEYTKM